MRPSACRGPCRARLRRCADASRPRGATQAEQLLTRNHANALTSLEAVKAEVLSLRDSITTTEARAPCMRARVRAAAEALCAGVHRARL